MNKELLFFCKLFANEVTQLQYSGEISKAWFYVWKNYEQRTVVFLQVICKWSHTVTIFRGDKQGLILPWIDLQVSKSENLNLWQFEEFGNVILLMTSFAFVVLTQTDLVPKIGRVVHTWVLPPLGSLVNVSAPERDLPTQKPWCC